MERDFIKIINETYSLIDFFPEGDPLKAKAKEKALEIMENLTIFFGEKEGRLPEKLYSDIAILTNYLKLGKDQGFLNDINFLILSKEYEKIKSDINVPGTIADKKKEPISPSDKEITVYENSEIKGGAMMSSTGFSERQGKILKILKEKTKAQVSDIIKEIPNVTKRTVRRDLDDLLKKGKVTRVGEWNQVFYRLGHNMS